MFRFVWDCRRTCSNACKFACFLNDWYLEHLDAFVSIDAPEARRFSIFQPRGHISWNVFLCSRTGLCLNATNCNALDSAGQHKEALSFAQTKLSSRSLTCSETEKWKNFWSFWICNFREFDCARPGWSVGKAGIRGVIGLTLRLGHERWLGSRPYRYNRWE